MANKEKKTARERLEVAHWTIIMFVGIILGGTLLLMLPFAHKTHLSFVDALFTATSATCITGLLTINVAETFTTFGQVVIGILIQLGAIGIVTVSTIFLLMLGKSVSMRSSSLIHDTFTASHKINIRKLLTAIISFLLAFEVVGAILFVFLWMPEMGLKDALFHGIFHSVSAFCNAGISTFSEGLIGFEKDMPSNTIVLFLLIVGGVGFMTIAEIYDRIKSAVSKKNPQNQKRIGWSFQIKLILVYTFVSIVLGSALLMVFEFNNAHAGMPFKEQLMSAVFHTSSSRTAGFSNIDLSHFSNTTLYMFVILMFIGGAPISTAGGIKVTTLALLIGMGVSRYRGSQKVQIMNRAVSEEVISRAISIVFIAVILVITFIFLLLITESHPAAVPNETRADFFPIIFEAFSAFGTVGLSMGITPSLSVAGKILIALLMLMGRLGPLTIAMAVATGKSQSTYEYAEETVMVG